MAGKVEEMRRLLKDAEQWILINQKYSGLYPDGWSVNQQTEEDHRQYMVGYAAIEKMRDHHFDYLKLLLPIVEAAAAFYKEAMQYGDLPEVSDETIERLNIALKSLE